MSAEGVGNCHESVLSETNVTISANLEYNETWFPKLVGNKSAGVQLQEV